MKNIYKYFIKFLYACSIAFAGGAIGVYIRNGETNDFRLYVSVTLFCLVMINSYNKEYIKTE